MFLLFSAMINSETYLSMFRELISTHFDGGPFYRNYSNVKMYEAHQVGKSVGRRSVAS